MPVIPGRMIRQTSLPRLEEIEDEWESQTIHLTLYRDDGSKRQVEVTGKVRGALIVHSGASTDDENRWAVSHIASGRRLSHFLQEKDAQRCVEILWASCCLSLREETPEAIREALPKWVQPWLALCTKVGAYLSPTSFQQNHK